MQLAIVMASMLMALAWLGYSIVPAFDIVPADSVGMGSSYFVAPGLGMFLIALCAILIPSGVFGRRSLVVVSGLLLGASIGISPWLYAGHDPSHVRQWLHLFTFLLITMGTCLSNTWRIGHPPAQTIR
jgi:hypothetical protein